MSEPTSTRTSVTLPSDMHKALEVIAKQKKVSLAWVLRDAADHYITTHAPVGHTTQS